MTSHEMALEIAGFLRSYPGNRIAELDDLEIFAAPLVGFAAADDRLYQKYKEPEVIGPAHLAPCEWLAGAKTVVSYFLPFSERIRETNGASRGLPSLEWVYGRYEGEMVNDAVRAFVAERLRALGGDTLVPIADPRYQIVDKRSNWSERHTAFAAGLGTFGLGRSIITQKGCAGRFGSVLTSLALEPTPRPYTARDEYCTYCGECIPRCPGGAITPAGKDVVRCSDYQDNEVKPLFKPRYGCGKCQTAVACETRIPPKINLESKKTGGKNVGHHAVAP